MRATSILMIASFVMSTPVSTLPLSRPDHFAESGVDGHESGAFNGTLNGDVGRSNRDVLYFREMNFVHTTDMHGWIAKQKDQGDLGDVLNFVTHVSVDAASPLKPRDPPFSAAASDKEVLYPSLGVDHRAWFLMHVFDARGRSKSLRKSKVATCFSSTPVTLYRYRV